MVSLIQDTKVKGTYVDLTPQVVQMLAAYIEAENRRLAPAKLTKKDVINEAIRQYIERRNSAEEAA